MIETKRFTCIGCPIGCPLQLRHDGTAITEVSGHGCDRGAKYARQEFSDPRRSVSTTVAIRGARWSRLPVKVTAPITKGRVMAAVREIHRLQVSAPVAMGQVLIENIMAEQGVHVVACRAMARWSPGPGAAP